MKTYIFLLAGLARPVDQLEKQMVMYLVAWFMFCGGAQSTLYYQALASLDTVFYVLSGRLQW